MGDAEESPERSSLSRSLLHSTASIVKSKLYKTLTMKDLTFDQYRFALFITLIINLVFLSLQVIRFGFIVFEGDDKDHDISIVIIAFILTTINCGYLVKLMYAPTPRFAVACMGIILVQEVLFIVQTVLYYGDFAKYPAVIALSVIFLFLQVFTIIPVYRFWEIVLFNYDDGNWAGSPSTGNISDVNLEGVVDGRKSTGGIHPSKVKAQMHIDKMNKSDKV